MFGGFVGFLDTTRTTGEMNSVTRTENPTTTRLTTLVHAHCSRSTDCRCGQQLDLCARAHCPRCGRSISRS
jgi:hypothetical protein